MSIELSTPALLFPAVSLLLLAYTNRFLALANLIRDLHDRYKKNPDQLIIGQIANLHYRVHLIKHMQGFGVASILLCTASIFELYVGWVLAGQIAFAISLVLMMISLAISLREIQVSVDALTLRLKDLEVKNLD